MLCGIGYVEADRDLFEKKNARISCGSLSAFICRITAAKIVPGHKQQLIAAGSELATRQQRGIQSAVAVRHRFPQQLACRPSVKLPELQRHPGRRHSPGQVQHMGGQPAAHDSVPSGSGSRSCSRKPVILPIS
ncbi:hypothetical protein D3C75_1155130 [compost metagenome]